MNLLARFKAIDENHKSAVVRKLIESGTPDFDYFYLVALSILMATLGLILDSAAIVIGSMLIAPILYPILGIALGITMSNGLVVGRSFLTLIKSFIIGLSLSVVATLLFGSEAVTQNVEVLARTTPSEVYFIVAFVAGLAVSFALAQPQWSETLPGIAISVALIPPLATIGVGIAALDVFVITEASLLLLLNLAGIIFAALISFGFMDLHGKQSIAKSTIKKEAVRLEAEQKAIEKVAQKEVDELNT